MPIPSRALVNVLLETADRLEGGADYQWAHFGRCNCGHLVQTVTRLSPAEIHAASAPEMLEWSEIPEDLGLPSKSGLGAQRVGFSVFLVFEVNRREVAD